MISSILPAGVEWAEVFGDEDGALYPEESALVERAVERRRREFVTGRVCARRALSRLGVAAGPILKGTRNEPLWPDGVVGSITHCLGYRAAAVAFARDVVSIGIDAEPNEPLPDGVESMVATPDEMAAMPVLDGVDGAHLVFCAKEAVYKAWYPQTHRWLGFEDAVVTIDPAGAFSVSLLVPGPSLTGQWLAAGGLLAAVAVIVP